MAPPPVPSFWRVRLKSLGFAFSNPAETYMWVDMVTVQVFVSLQTGPSSHLPPSSSFEANAQTTNPQRVQQ